MSEMIERLSSALEGRYRIERELGSGGMATVYLAEDVRHRRKVAVKVLKPELAAVVGADRFLAEIETTANLTHPNILPLFDSGEKDGFLFYVMPYVEDESLRERLEKEKQLPVDQTVRMITDVAEALDHAHRHGVIHRDVKPANILLQDGRPVVADFGIALAVSNAGGGRLTETGLSLGTPYYMSPEQATGDREVDARSDTYALACVAYELLTGEPPHSGNTAQAILGRILMGDVDPPTMHRKSIPANVEAALMKALEKLPADRFASAGKFAEALRNPAFRHAGGTTGPSAATGRAARGTATNRAATVGLAGLSVVLAAALAWLATRPAPEAPVTRYALELEGEGLASVAGTRVAMTSDGSSIVYVVPDEQEASRLLLRSRTDLEPTMVPGSEGAMSPFFSPDGTQVGFVEEGANQTLVVASLSGRPPQTLVDDGLVGSDGASWSDDGYIYYDGLTAGSARGIMRVRASGGDPEQVTVIDTANGEVDHVWPHALPGGDGFLMTVVPAGGQEAADIALADPATGEVTVLVRGVAAWYAMTGHLIYATADGILMAAPFDPGAGRLTGDPVPITDGLVLRDNAAVDLALSRNGRLVYFTGPAESELREIVRVDRNGTTAPIRLPAETGPPISVSVSPDGSQLAYSTREPAGEKIWAAELPVGPVTLLTPWPRRSRRPVWSRDGRSVAFISNADGGRWHGRQVRADGSSPTPDTILLAEGAVFELVTPDAQGRQVFRTGDIGPNLSDIGYRDLNGDSIVWLLTSGSNETAAALSPDGRWLAYVSEFTGRREVYVRPFPNVATRRVQVSARGGTEPVWSRDGSELFFRSAEGWMIAAEILAAPEFTVGTRDRLFDANRFRNADVYRGYDVAPDGQFVMIRDVETGVGDPGRLIVVESWFHELSALADGS